jgi:hypothetical protein
MGLRHRAAAGELRSTSTAWRHDVPHVYQVGSAGQSAAYIYFSKNPRPCQINQSITPEMERILMKAGDKPEDRHASVGNYARAGHRAYLMAHPRIESARPRHVPAVRSVFRAGGVERA